MGTGPFEWGENQIVEVDGNKVSRKDSDPQFVFVGLFPPISGTATNDDIFRFTTLISKRGLG